MDFIKITEQESNHKDLEKKSVIELVNAMHQEDKNALNAVNKVLPRVSEVIEAIAPKIKKGGRLFYIGAGTSGRLGVQKVDAGTKVASGFGVDPTAQTVTEQRANAQAKEEIKIRVDNKQNKLLILIIIIYKLLKNIKHIIKSIT